MVLSALLLALALQATPTPSPADVRSEIVVLGTKMKAWKAAADERRCWTLTSSGDKAIDAIGCAVVKTCIAQLGPQLKAARKKRRTTEGKALYKAVHNEIETCVALRRDTLIAELAERRFQARQGANGSLN